MADVNLSFNDIVLSADVDQQTTIDSLTNVSAASSGQVLTKNGSGNAVFMDAGGVNFPITIANGGTGQTTRQEAIDALTDVSNATNEYVLTKDTTTGNAIFKEAQGGSSSTSYLMSFDNGDLSSGVLTVPHNLNQKYIHATIFDNLDRKINPSFVTAVNATTCTIDINPYGSIAGTWNVLITK